MLCYSVVSFNLKANFCFAAFIFTYSLVYLFANLQLNSSSAAVLHLILSIRWQVAKKPESTVDTGVVHNSMK